ncbi:succinate dehydrogenase / fumarate reductase flavoprotein subunit [Halogranum gelatinilyticum]|uniref:Succinate dehydrogenase / fumarate reductase flavoprotein subunit n=1 Tax=Halogranum gelatinilyticum TaxID=660521 RepID=A0A1G9W5R7_9EURY|nr:FAD-dependent oxidoreductase [Halogranum gelatinilyticum]SDM79884.1 succinate dehydrogenase / fumarate reductase flavoprotein subunit [Halogranum gelatinilyticum]
MTPTDPSVPEEAVQGVDTENVEYEEVTVPVLVVGAGAAGARTAISLKQAGVEPLVIGKRDHGDAHTTWAAGGINAALGSLDEEDDWTVHAADTYDEGHFINDPDAVELVAKGMPDRIRELDEWGMPFDRTEDGKINQRYFGAQSFRRTCFVGDRTGEAILETLVAKAQELEIPYRDNVMVTRLLSDGSRVYGAAGYDMEDGHFVVFTAEHVVLAAGGFSAIYNRHSSRDDENNGDGPALAYEAGASLLDTEFVQFHPTGMVQDPDWEEEWGGRLVTEAVRGEGGRLFNSEGERFMERYSPDQMELDARDVVARAIAQEVREGRGTENGGVYLDISHRDRDFIEERLPRMYERFQSLGVDMAEEPVEVAPTAHYTMGGVDIDFNTGETGVEGLYAVGETVAGVHGANRLGGNSLAETVAIGKLVGDHVANQVTGETPELPGGMRALAQREFAALEGLETSDGDVTPEELHEAFGELMWEHAGILRDEESLKAGLERLQDLRERTADLRVDGDRTSLAFEYAVDLSFTFTVGEAILRGALEREESRGAHFREDFTETDETWRKNILVDRGDTGMGLTTRGVGEPSPEVQAAIDEGHELDYHHLE